SWFVDSNAADLANAHGLVLDFDFPLTNGGGAILLFDPYTSTGGAKGICSTAPSCNGIGISALITGGSVTTTPEPTTWSLLALGLGAVVMKKRLVRT
ncbi:MAG: PEP-CTERM sorting domain-containing protein, partial [Acidobacteriota bacterium]